MHANFTLTRPQTRDNGVIDGQEMSRCRLLRVSRLRNSFGWGGVSDAEAGQRIMRLLTGTGVTLWGFWDVW